MKINEQLNKENNREEQQQRMAAMQRKEFEKEIEELQKKISYYENQRKKIKLGR